MDKQVIRCPNCGSDQNYIRIRTKEMVCRKCGSIIKLEEEEELEDG